MTITKELVYVVVSGDCQNHELTQAKPVNIYRDKDGVERVNCLGGKREIMRARNGDAVFHLDYRSIPSRAAHLSFPF